MSSQVIFQDARKICSRVNLDSLGHSTILVTGASGLIGTYILACLCHLRERGIPVQVCAHHLSDLPSHVVEMVTKCGFKAIRANLADFNGYKLLPEADIIIHAAGYAQPSIFMANPLVTIQVNTSATIALVRRLRNNGKFLFLSSSEIYSGLKKPMFRESDIGRTNPSHKRAPYIEGKRCGEAICNAYRAQGIDIKTGRIALTYGPGTRKHDGRAMNSFIEQALCQRKIVLRDSGDAIRTYCYVADTVELLWQILLHGTEAVYNVGGQSTVTIADLARVIAEMTGATIISPSVQRTVAGAPYHVHLDTTKIETEFGKKQYVGLEEGLRATIKWQQEVYL